MVMGKSAKKCCTPKHLRICRDGLVAEEEGGADKDEAVLLALVSFPEGVIYPTDDDPEAKNPDTAAGKAAFADYVRVMAARGNQDAIDISVMNDACQAAAYAPDKTLGDSMDAVWEHASGASAGAKTVAFLHLVDAWHRNPQPLPVGVQAAGVCVLPRAARRLHAGRAGGEGRRGAAGFQVGASPLSARCGGWLRSCVVPRRRGLPHGAGRA